MKIQYTAYALFLSASLMGCNGIGGVDSNAFLAAQSSPADGGEDGTVVLDPVPTQPPVKTNPPAPSNEIIRYCKGDILLLETAAIYCYDVEKNAITAGNAIDRGPTGGDDVIKDIATSPSGELFGVDKHGLYRIEFQREVYRYNRPDNKTKATLVQLPGLEKVRFDTVNSLTFLPDGRLAFMAYSDDIKNPNNYGTSIRPSGYGIHLYDFKSEKLDLIPVDYNSSGDLVYHSDGFLYLSALGATYVAEEFDYLIQIDISNGRVKEVGKIPVSTWGLASLDGKLYGFTGIDNHNVGNFGRAIEINPVNAEWKNLNAQQWNGSSHFMWLGATVAP